MVVEGGYEQKWCRAGRARARREPPTVITALYRLLRHLFVNQIREMAAVLLAGVLVTA
jgi:hypothetical protein